MMSRLIVLMMLIFGVVNLSYAEKKGSSGFTVLSAPGTVTGTINSEESDSTQYPSDERIERTDNRQLRFIDEQPRFIQFGQVDGYKNNPWVDQPVYMWNSPMESGVSPYESLNPRNPVNTGSLPYQSDLPNPWNINSSLYPKQSSYKDSSSINWMPGMIQDYNLPYFSQMPFLPMQNQGYTRDMLMPSFNQMMPFFPVDSLFAPSNR